MKIREAEPRDFPVIRELLTSMWELHKNREPDFIIKNWQNFDVTKYLDCSRELSTEKNSAYVAIIDEKVAGVMTVQIREISSFFKETKILYVDDLSVAKNFQHRGVGTALLKFAEDLAKENDIKWLKSRVYEFNESMQSLNEKFGYKKLYSAWFKEVNKKEEK